MDSAGKEFFREQRNYTREINLVCNFELQKPLEVHYE